MKARATVCRILGAAMVIAAALGAGPRADAQDMRERVTALLDDAQRRLGESADELQRQQLQRHIELYKHRLGYRDFHDRPLTWNVSYQKRLVEQLDGEIARMESATKGGWGLASKGDDARRAVRIVARDLLRRADTEPDETERSRYGFAGMLLVHNADVIDPVLDALAKVTEARKAAGDADSPERAVLGRALAGADSLIAMAQQVAGNQLRIGHSELWRLARDLDRLREGAAFVIDGKLPPAPAETVSDDDRRKAECDELAGRAAALATAEPALAAHLAAYVEQARFGLTVERVRPVAEAILAHVRTALDVAESLVAGKVGSPAYRRAVLDRLAAAVAGIDQPERREAAFGEVRRIDGDDRLRRQFESMPMADAVKADLWLGMEWIQSQMSKPPDDQLRQEAERLRDPLQRLWWRTRDLYAATQPQNAHFKAPLAKGLKVLEAAMAQIGKDLRSPVIGIAQKCWRLDALINDLHLVRRAGCDLDALTGDAMPSSSIRSVAQQAAAALCDDSPDNDNAARPVVQAMADAFRLLVEFHGTTIPRDGLADVNLLTRGRHAATFKKQASRCESLIKTLVEGNRQEYDVLRSTMPLYQMTAAAVVLGASGAPAGDVDRLRAARHLTADPALVRQAVRPAVDRLAEAFLQLTRIAPAELDNTVRPVAVGERLARPAAAALVELRRDAAAGSRMDLVVADLQAAARGDPGNNVRDRWLVSWHLNQAVEAYLAGYEETGDFHGDELRRRNPLLTVRLGTP
ncbi:MAG TPA: hypothetical protein PLP01_05520 [Phycisphaerae bacterium]|nr:hypothetical protein [Phycisphaerae bacterium]